MDTVNKKRQGPVPAEKTPKPTQSVATSVEAGKDEPSGARKNLEGESTLVQMHKMKLDEGGRVGLVLPSSPQQNIPHTEVAELPVTQAGPVPAESDPLPSTSAVMPMETGEEGDSVASDCLKGSGAQRRKLAWKTYLREKEEAERKGLPPPNPPPRRKSGSQRKKEKKAVAGASTRLADAPAAPKNQKGGQATAKRKMETSVSDPSVKPATKKVRQGPNPVGQRGSAFAALASSLPKVLVTVGETLGEKLSMSVFEEIKGCVLDQILELTGEGVIPKFRDTVLQHGKVIFVCEDEDTEKWLREVVPSLKLSDGTQVRLVRPEELIKRVKMTLKVPPPKREPGKVLKLINMQNSGLETKNWVVHKAENLEGNSTLLVLGVDVDSANVLKVRNYRVHLGTGQATFKVA